MYKLYWWSKIVDSAETFKEALYLKREWEMVYGGTVTIVKEKI